MSMENGVPAEVSSPETFSWMQAKGWCNDRGQELSWRYWNRYWDERRKEERVTRRGPYEYDRSRF